ncbi:MAG: radical SAM protein, partial [Gemmatimonadetes bacterium]|nr:radical SAM protein [Gemmatimonadota bacterium]
MSRRSATDGTSSLGTRPTEEARAPRTGWIRRLRPPKEPVDPWRALGHRWELERAVEGGAVPTLTVFLAGAECHFTCVFCDLWRRTLDGATPTGAVPAQLRQALREAGPPPAAAAIKLYNASNFFDARAVPEDDEPALIELLRPFARATVECHPRLVGERCLRFAERLAGRLEVALGLETINPIALPLLNKRMRLEDFDRATAELLAAGIGVRAFVLLSPPYVASGEAVEWAVRSVRYAVDRGAQRVSIIPVRAGNGALDALARSGQFVPPTLAQLESALDECVEATGAVITADLWEAERLVTCAACGPRRLE